jgi:hypothetical protein
VMRLFTAREALDPHARRIFPLLDPKKSILEKLKLVAGLFGHYSFWLPKQYLPTFTTAGADQVPQRLKSHVMFANKTSRKLARNLFLAMMLYQQGLERKQRLLARVVNIGTDLFAIAATCSHAAALVAKDPSNRSPIDLADHFCRDARGRIRKQFKGIFRNRDAASYALSRKMLAGEYQWLEDGIIPPP